ncbi:MAG: MASE1 domain-containing protein [Alphaproteobacteria bacterium]
MVDTTASNGMMLPLPGFGRDATGGRSAQAVSGPGRWLVGNAVTALLYCALGLAVSEFFASYGLFPAPIWLPSSIAVVAAMAGGVRLAPGIFLGSFVANWLLFQPPVYEAALISLANAAGPLAGAAMLSRFRPERGLFTRFSGVVAFILCLVVLHPAITASGGTACLALEGGKDAGALYSIWIAWWLSDSGGTLCFAPALLLWLGTERETFAAEGPTPRRRIAIWTTVAAGSVALFATLPLPGAVPWGLPFLLVVPLSWIALRMSLRAAYTLVSLVAVVAAGATVAGYGPFQAPGVANPLQLVGVLVVLLAVTVLTIVSLVSELHEAEAASRRKSMAVASTSHDLRTPLNAIIGFAELMRTGAWGPIENARYRKYVEHIHESGLLLLEIIEGVLDLSKIEAGRREIVAKPLAWEEVSEPCLRLLAGQATQKSVTLAARATPGLRIHADPLALRQILLNLLANAIKFTHSGGHVTLRAAAAADGCTDIEVVDDGIGMDEAGIARALEPYGQVAGSGQGGTGLGLPIAARLVALHGGGMTIDSAPGKGTTVRITLPGPRT